MFVFDIFAHSVESNKQKETSRFVAVEGTENGTGSHSIIGNRLGHVCREPEPRRSDYSQWVSKTRKAYLCSPSRVGTLDDDPKQCRNAWKTRRVRSRSFASSFATNLDLSSSPSVYTRTTLSNIFACISAGEQVLPHWTLDSISAFIGLRDTRQCQAA